MDDERIRTTCPRDCYDACGIVVVKRDGQIARVRGDPEHPVARGALCGKCQLAYNGVWIDDTARLIRPLRRNGPKGSGSFEAVTWDTALGEIASALQGIVRGHGGASVLHAHYTGTCSLIAGGFPQRFFNRLGATEVEPDTICNNAGHVALRYVFGTSTAGFDPRTARDARCVLLWGVNPSASAPHAHKHWLREIRAPIVVIDPVRHETAAAADLHLQLRPGTDAALAYAMLHILWRDQRLDRDFLAKRTLGWDEVEATLEPFTPEWGERMTGVPAGSIEQAVELYAEGPALLWLGQGLQRQPRGGNAFRACALLPAASGNFGKPGAGLLFLNGAGERDIDTTYVEMPELRSQPMSSISHMDLADVLRDRSRSRAFFCWNMNVAASAPRQEALRAALAREDLLCVVAELFMTDTARYADYVLPAASFLEFDDLVIPYFHLSLSAQAKTRDPPGHALPNQEIFRRLATAMGYREPALQESDATILDEVLARSGHALDFDELKRRGTVALWADPFIRFADGQYPTPSGRIELASAAAEQDGHPRIPEPWADAVPEAGRFRLLSPADTWLLNDSYANEPRIAAILGSPDVAIHPADAARLGIAEGAQIRLSTAIGHYDACARVSDEVRPGVLLTHKGRWGSNVNRLNPGTRTDMGRSSAVHGIEVTLTAERSGS